ncbi:MAG: four helix bundle protein [Flavobacteriales bacterium]
MHDYTKLRIWNDGLDLVEEVYKATGIFPKDERFGLTSQVRRSAVSMPSNIAEGAVRRTDGEFKQFLGLRWGQVANCTPSSLSRTGSASWKQLC